MFTFKFSCFLLRSLGINVFVFPFEHNSNPYCWSMHSYVSFTKNTYFAYSKGRNFREKTALQMFQAQFCVLSLTQFLPQHEG